MGYRALTTGSALRALPYHHLTSPPCSPSTIFILPAPHLQSLTSPGHDGRRGGRADLVRPGTRPAGGGGRRPDRTGRGRGQSRNWTFVRVCVACRMAALLLRVTALTCRCRLRLRVCETWPLAEASSLSGWWRGARSEA